MGQSSHIETNHGVQAILYKTRGELSERVSCCLNSRLELIAKQAPLQIILHFTKQCFSTAACAHWMNSWVPLMPEILNNFIKTAKPTRRQPPKQLALRDTTCHWLASTAAHVSPP